MSMDIFLSASVPDPKRHPRYIKTCDVTAIRDAVVALVTVALPTCRLIWGGHPAITPLIKVTASSLGMTGRDKVVLYQSKFWAAKRRPADNEAFEEVVLTPKVQNDRAQSLKRMRDTMINSYNFRAGVFIGGMEGVEEEYDLFIARHPDAIALPLASTGAAALRIFNRPGQSFSPELKTDLAYPSLFRSLLNL